MTGIGAGHECWYCSRLRDTALAVKSPGQVKETPFVLQLDDSQDSRFVHLVAKWASSRRQSSNLLILPPASDQARRLTLRSSSGGVEIEGPSTICRALLGEVGENDAEVSQWLSWRNAADSTSDSAQLLDAHLRGRAVVAGGGTAITLADLAAFSLVHSAESQLAPAKLVETPNLLRWLLYVQEKAHADEVYERVHVNLPRFCPPSQAVA